MKNLHMLLADGIYVYVDSFEGVSVVALDDVLVGLDRYVGCVVDMYEEISRKVGLESELYSTCPLQCVGMRDRDICDRTIILDA